MQNKPTSKAISVTSSGGEYIYTTTIACEDGSVWEYSRNGSGGEYSDKGEWICILEAPTQPKSDLPEVGSRWRHTIDNREVIVKDIKPTVSYKFKCGTIHRILVEQFLDSYEPIPTKSDNKE